MGRNNNLESYLITIPFESLYILKIKFDIVTKYLLLDKVTFITIMVCLTEKN